MNCQNVSDTQSPKITEIEDQTYIVSVTQTSIDVKWTEPEVHDNSGVYTVWSSYHSGDAFNIGTTSVTYSAIDSSGNKKSMSFSVRVVGKVNLEFYNRGKSTFLLAV